MDKKSRPSGRIVARSIRSALADLVFGAFLMLVAFSATLDPNPTGTWWANLFAAGLAFVPGAYCLRHLIRPRYTIAAGLAFLSTVAMLPYAPPDSMPMFLRAAGAYPADAGKAVHHISLMGTDGRMHLLGDMKGRLGTFLCVRKDGCKECSDGLRLALHYKHQHAVPSRSWIDVVHRGSPRGEPSNSLDLKLLDRDGAVAAALGLTGCYVVQLDDSRPEGSFYRLSEKSQLDDLHSSLRQIVPCSESSK